MRLLLLLGLLWLTGCIHQASLPLTYCQSETLREAQWLVKAVDQQQQSTDFIMATAESADQLTLLAFNPVGAKLFSAVLRSGGLQVEQARFYQGLNARDVSAAIALFIYRDRAPQCWQMPGAEVIGDLQTTRLMMRGKLYVLINKDYPNQIHLPAAGLTITLTEME